jgi:O-antigen ligase/polysaccharide polymerase Wzy-like membrane protein
MLAGAAMAPFNFFAGISISGLYLRPLHLWAFAAALVFLALYRRETSAVIDGPILAFSAMFAFILLSTLFATPPEYKFRGIADVGLLALNVVGFAVVRSYYAIRPEKWLRFFSVLGVSSICMSLGLIARALMAASSGMVTGVDSYALGLGTVAGTYTATFAAASTAAMVFAMSRRGFLLALGAFVVHGLAMLLSLARGPWLAFLVAVVTMIPIVAWRLRGRFTMLGTLIRGGSIVFALPTLAGVVLVASPFVRKLVVQRVVQLVKLDAGTGSARLIMWKAFLTDGLRSPLFGHGAAAYRDISEHLGVQGTVSENFVVEIFHAGGMVAVVLLLVALVSVLLHCLLSPGAARRPAQTAACLVGAVALVIGSMTNPAAWNGLFWLILGVVASRPLGDESPAPSPVKTTKRVAPIATRGAVAQ